EAPAVRFRPIEQRAKPRFPLPSAQVEVSLSGERHVHHRERHLDELPWSLALGVPRTERVRDSGPEPRRIAEAERRVVREARLLEVGEVALRVEPEEVVALAAHRPGELLE